MSQPHGLHIGKRCAEPQHGAMDADSAGPDGEATRIGDVFIRAKNGYNNANKLRYCPDVRQAIRIPKPAGCVVVESINGTDILQSGEMPELKARKSKCQRLHHECRRLACRRFQRHCHDRPLRCRKSRGDIGQRFGGLSPHTTTVSLVLQQYQLKSRQANGKSL